MKEEINKMNSYKIELEENIINKEKLIEKQKIEKENIKEKYEDEMKELMNKIIIMKNESEINIKKNKNELEIKEKMMQDLKVHIILKQY